MDSSESDFKKDQKSLSSLLKTMNFPEYHQIVKSVIRADALLAGQRKILKLLANRAPLFQVLHLLVSIMEEQYDGLLCSILLVDEKTQTFKSGVEANYSQGFTYDLAGVSILPPYLGPCCKATNLGEFVVSEDIEADPNWSDRWKVWAKHRGLKSCRSHPIFSSTGSVLGAFAMYLKDSADVSFSNVYQIELATHIAGIAIERRQIEAREREWRQKMQEVNENLERSVQIRDEFLHVTTHELNSPLATMKMWTTYKKENLMESGVFDKKAILSMLESHEKQIDRVLSTIKTITDAAYLDDGQQILNCTNLNINELLQDIVERLKPVLDESECVVELTTVGEIHGVWDQIRLEQVFTNLITNAMKYGGPGVIQIVSELNGDKVKICIKDNGKGIAPEYHQKIFERYQRVKSKENVTRGLGLGLYIAREIIIAHGGRIFVESDRGQGANFVIELPLQKEAEGNIEISNQILSL